MHLTPFTSDTTHCMTAKWIDLHLCINHSDGCTEYKPFSSFFPMVPVSWDAMYNEFVTGKLLHWTADIKSI